MRAMLTDLWATDRTRVVTIGAVFAMVAVNQCGTGLLNAVIPVKLAADGYSAATAGGISTVFSICFLIGCAVGPLIVRGIGPAHTPLVLGLANGTLALLHWLFPGPFTWGMFRGLGGITTATFFLLVECWLSTHAPDKARGLVFGLYLVMNRVAFALGQLTLAFVEPNVIIHLLLVAAVAYALAPLLRPRGDTAMPPLNRPSLAGFLELPRRAPASACAALINGLVFGAVPNLLPKWGVEQGIAVGTIAQALAMVQLGGLVLQMPLSIAADRFERRTIMAVAMAGTAAAALGLLLIAPDRNVIWLLLVFLWGGCASSTYSLAAAHASALAPPADRAMWVSSLMLIWGVGAAAGPMIAALAMDAMGGAMLWRYSILVSVGGSMFLLWRKLARP